LNDYSLDFSAGVLGEENGTPVIWHVQRRQAVANRIATACAASFANLAQRRGLSSFWRVAFVFFISASLIG